MSDRRTVASEAPAELCAASQLAAVFDGTFDGFLTVIHAHYYDKLNPAYIWDESSCQQTLDTELMYITADADKAERVYKSFTKISADAPGTIIGAFLSSEPDRFINLYQYILLGYKVGAAVDSYEQLDYVLRVHKLSRYTYKEWHLLRGFCRFAETESGVFYCSITPVNNVLSLLADHFCERFMNQQWVIHDTRRGLAAVYDGNKYEIRTVPKDANFNYTESEEGYQALWKLFHETIGVEARRNYKLQRGMLPLRYRGNMTEFK
jgi:probable DNA metabolism protein